MAFLLSPMGRYLIIGLAAVALLLGALWYIRAAESTKVKLEVIQKEQKLEENIKDEIDNSPSTVDGILDFLRRR